VASMSPLRNASHRRLNPLTGEWVLVSPHRTQRPWQGRRELKAATPALAHDPDCYLCPGNLRANGVRNPDYPHTFVFDNDFPALKADAPTTREVDGLLVAEGETGLCRVLCFSPRHDLTLAGMAVADIERVVDVWVEETIALGGLPDIASVQIFENRGEMMGASNPHPHGQIWATRHLPNELEKETDRQAAYLVQHGRPLLVDYLDRELDLGERVVLANDDFCVLVPFWAIWPFETMILPRRRIGGFDELKAGEKTSLAAALSELTRRYDKLFDAPFPYSMGFHQKPTDGAVHAEWQMHGHFYPPLLRSATIKKFMVGFEMLGSPQRDLTPEAAAGRLREALE
jgi:UDPglucose--hexose-1-phosphate uridylyltransferase